MNYEEMAKQASEIADALRTAANDDNFYVDEFEAGCFYQQCVDAADAADDLAEFLKDLAAEESDHAKHVV